jgi:ubiquinone/menaquinone biosynthesis C-methylase UbiE
MSKIDDRHGVFLSASAYFPYLRVLCGSGGPMSAMGNWEGNSVILSFDDLAKHFDGQRGLPAAALREWVASINIYAVGRTLRIIEPGIGTGRISLPLAASGHEVTGVDISQSMLDACARKEEMIGAAGRVTLIHADASDLPVEDGDFDVGVMASLLYLVPQWEGVLDELARVVRPGGSVVHLVERTESGDALQLWDIAWRARIESTGYRHPALRPALQDVQAEFTRRWPDTRTELIASWTFGQSVAEGRDCFGERLRPLYARVDEGEWRRVVRDFLHWSEMEFPDPDTRLDGQVILEALIAHT